MTILTEEQVQVMNLKRIDEFKDLSIEQLYKIQELLLNSELTNPKHEEQISDLQDEINDLEIKIEEDDWEYNKLEEKYDELEEKYEELKDNYKELKDKYEKKQQA